MPIECALLRNAKVSLDRCPACGALFRPSFRGMVQRRKKKYWLWGDWPYCALICSQCETIVGHESPDGSVDISWKPDKE